MPDTEEMKRLYNQTLDSARFTAHPARRAAPTPAAGDVGLPRFTPRATATGEPRFHAEAVLGMGATGQVYSVRDRNLERMVAVKVLLPDLAADAEAIDGFAREARTTAALEHPNVLPVHDYDFTDDGRPFISLGRIQGRSLGALLEESHPAAPHPALASWNTVVSIAIAVCNAVAYAHHHAVIHQDIKPDNIMVGDFGEVLLVDWGSAGKADADGRVVGSLYGTPLYMSPEQARQEGADRRSDVYCLGATLFHALTRRLPCWDEDPERFWARKRAGEIDPPSPAERRATPTELLAIALKAMAPDPADRYASAEALRRDLEQYQAGLAVSAHRDSPWRRFRRWHRRNAKVFWISAAAIALVTAALGVAASELLKLRGGWIEALSEDFHERSLADLEPTWRLRLKAGWTAKGFEDAPLAAPRAALADGGLVLDAGGDLVDVSLRDPILGDVAIEWDYRALVSGNDLNCFIGAGDREDREHQTGFTFHIGGFDRTDRCTVTRGPDFEFLCSHELAAPLEVGRTYRFRLERESRHVRLAIDGRQIIDWLDAEALGAGLGQRFGFDCIVDQRVWIGNVRVWQRRLAQRVSPLEVGDRLYQVGSYAEAAEVYRTLAKAYDGDLAVRAEFRLHLCSWRLGRPQAAIAEFAAFAAEHAAHELAPYALAYRARIARAAGLTDELERARSDLTRIAGHPLLAAELHQIAFERTEAIGDDVHGPELVARAQRVSDELERWSRAYGMPLTDDRRMGHLATQLISDGAYAAAIGMRGIDESVRGIAYLEMGRMDEALAAARRDASQRALVLLELGRLREAADETSARSSIRELALYWLGDFAGMRRLDPHHQLTEDLLIYEGHAADYLVAHPSDEFSGSYGITPRVAAMLAAGRCDDILREYTHYAPRMHADLALGRLDAAFAEATEDHARIPVLARMAELGRSDRIEEWLRARSPTAPYALSMLDAYWQDWVARSLFRAAAGDLAGARAELEPTLAQVMRECTCQRAWHLSAYALGRIDDAAFLAQPRRLQADAFLLVAQAMRLELAGDAATAAQRWREFLALPHWRRELDPDIFALARWRIRAAGLEMPPGIVPTINLCFR